jgi:hypothetical protein
MFESLGAQVGLIYGGWAVASGLVLAAIALYEALTSKPEVPETAVPPGPAPCAGGCNPESQPAAASTWSPNRYRITIEPIEERLGSPAAELMGLSLPVAFLVQHQTPVFRGARLATDDANQPQARP